MDELIDALIMACLLFALFVAVLVGIVLLVLLSPAALIGAAAFLGVGGLFCGVILLLDR